MRFVIQRVSESEVKVDGKVLGKIGKGFMVLIGVSDSDTKEIADKMVKKDAWTSNLRRRTRKDQSVFRGGRWRVTVDLPVHIIR